MAEKKYEELQLFQELMGYVSDKRITLPELEKIVSSYRDKITEHKLTVAWKSQGEDIWLLEKNSEGKQSNKESALYNDFKKRHFEFDHMRYVSKGNHVFHWNAVTGTVPYEKVLEKLKERILDPSDSNDLEEIKKRISLVRAGFASNDRASFFSDDSLVNKTHSSTSSVICVCKDGSRTVALEVSVTKDRDVYIDAVPFSGSEDLWDRNFAVLSKEKID